MEKWKTFHTNKYGTEYAISTYGRIKNVTLDKIKKPCMVGSGDLTHKRAYFKTCDYGEYVHRLVAKMFIPNPQNNPEVDHIDRNPLNNRVENLRWVDRKQNNRNRVSIKSILKNLQKYFSDEEISKITDISLPQIWLYTSDEINQVLSKCDALYYEES